MKAKKKVYVPTTEAQIKFQEKRFRVVQDLVKIKLEMLSGYDLRVDVLIQRHVDNVLRATGNNITMAADILGVNRRSLQRWMKKR